MQGIAAVDYLRNGLWSLTADQRGVTALEYAMIASLIATSAVSIMTSLGANLGSVFSSVSAAF
ncbi:MAG TPA: Flp family type IVb pilin [Acetobacteraceae bacterium]|nr:Flp family type IVb pilin [Acetobacteraceae bacterium]